MECSIQVENLTKSYNDVTAVEGIHINVRPGETFGLLGANGAGKTTTVECILGVKKPDTGKITVLGKDPTKNRSSLFEQVGVQFQEARYQDKIKVGELCRITAALYKEPEDYHDLLARFDLTNKEDSFVSMLSGGQRQKLFIILALIPRPRVVFLDELTTGLDVRARRGVWKNLASLKEKGITMFMTTHFMDEVEALCDLVAIMCKGRIVFEGTVAQAIESGPFETFEDAYLFYSEEDTYESI